MILHTFIKKILVLPAAIKRYRFFFYGLTIAVIVSFGAGFRSGWSMRGHIQDHKNAQAVSQDLITLEKQNEIDSMPYDYKRILNVLRDGGL